MKRTMPFQIEIYKLKKCINGHEIKPTSAETKRDCNCCGTSLLKAVDYFECN